MLAVWSKYCVEIEPLMGVQNYKLLWQWCWGYWVMRAELSTAQVMTKIILIIFDSCVGLSPLPLTSYTIQLWLPFKLWRRNKFRLDNIVCVNFCVLMNESSWWMSWFGNISCLIPAADTRILSVNFLGIGSNLGQVNNERQLRHDWGFLWPYDDMNCRVPSHQI